MEESPNQAQSTTVPQPPNPPTSGDALPPQAPKTNKRPLNGDALYSNSSCFKVRAVLKELRPHFLEVMRTPDFRRCKSATEIQEQVKLLMELYKQMTAETVPATRCKSGPEGQPLSGEKPQGIRAFFKPSENKFPPGEQQRAEEGQIEGRHVVGGSAFGWNFITVLGNEPAYYGTTKETFRANASKVTLP